MIQRAVAVAKRETKADRFRQIALGLFNRLHHAEAESKIRSDGRRIGASGSVRVLGVDARRREGVKT